VKDESEIQTLSSEVEERIHSIKSYSLGMLGVHQHEKLNTLGTDLWNLCTRLQRGAPYHADVSQERLLVLVRTFAFFVLALSHPRDNPTHRDLMRLVKLAIKAGRSCMGM
jgi:hypothetical protein